MMAFLLALLVTIQAPQVASPDQIKDTLARAEALYFEAKFNESIQLLSPINEALKSQPARVKERVATKFQLALANMGLNNAAAAKALLMEIYALDSDFTVDAQQFSPKVVTLANDAKTEARVVRCKTAMDDARKSLAGGDSVALLSTLQTMKPKCPDLGVLEPEAAELVFKKGLNDYKQGFLQGALQSFRSAVSLSPKHEMAAQYLELTETRLQVAGDRVLLDWQRNFQTRQFKQAAAVYRQIASFNDPGSAQTLNMMGSEYHKALDTLVDSFNKACASGDTTKGNEIRDQITELIPEPGFGAESRSKMVPCNPPPAPLLPTTPVVAAPPAADNRVAAKVEPKPPATSKPEPKSASPAGPKANQSTQKSDPSKSCFQMDSQLALHRLKQRVEPNFSPQALSYLANAQVTVNVKARIDENGNVTVLDATGANAIVSNSVRSAVELWKFTPAMDENGPRCVNTEIPIVISRK